MAEIPKDILIRLIERLRDMDSAIGDHYARLMTLEKMLIRPLERPLYDRDRAIAERSLIDPSPPSSDIPMPDLYDEIIRLLKEP
jgi:hypothetical protein